jgi:hypothetical protein
LIARVAEELVDLVAGAADGLEVGVGDDRVALVGEVLDAHGLEGVEVVEGGVDVLEAPGVGGLLQDDGGAEVGAVVRAGEGGVAGPEIAAVDIGGDAGEGLRAEVAVEDHGVVSVWRGAAGDDADPKLGEVFGDGLEDPEALGDVAGVGADVAGEEVGEGGAVAVSVVAAARAEDGAVEVDVEVGGLAEGAWTCARRRRRGRLEREGGGGRVRLGRWQQAKEEQRGGGGHTHRDRVTQVRHRRADDGAASRGGFSEPVRGRRARG